MAANSRRIKILLTIMSLAITCLIGRMAYLQLFDSEKLAGAAAQRQTQLIPGEDVPRGGIMDRNGISLTDSQVSVTAIIFPSMLKNPKEDSEKIAGVLGTSSGVITALTRNKDQAYIPLPPSSSRKSWS